LSNAVAKCNPLSLKLSSLFHNWSTYLSLTHLFVLQPAITSIAAGPNPANETVITFEMQPKTAGAAIPQEEQDNLRAAFTTIVENRDTLTLPAPYSPVSRLLILTFLVTSAPGEAMASMYFTTRRLVNL
jgi:hypothetical protein